MIKVTTLYTADSFSSGYMDSHAFVESVQCPWNALMPGTGRNVDGSWRYYVGYNSFNVGDR